ncbi:MAG: zinc-ribbon domain-containing protein [Gemmatimonadaceae bacterium]|nr:zinc-ribbon domain-containing protein [Gemmatimonadaceae bacterium]
MTSPNASSRPNSGAGFCAACGAALSAGARFCHRCGTPMGQGAPATPSQQSGGAASVLPWGVAFVALLALVAMFAGKNFGAAKGSSVDGSSNSLPTQAIDGPAAGGAPFAQGGGNGPAPDINNLSPSERANRLYTRIMQYAEFGKVDSVAFFAPMAMASHEMLERPTADERYHYGRIAEITGDAPVARAQADTILQQEPNNLLGLLLGARAARMSKDVAGEKTFNDRLLKVMQTELATGREDYEMHRAEIARAETEARK